SATDTEGHTRLWVRTLSSLEARVMPGTDGGADPFWAPDGRFLAFQSGGKLKRIDVSGGPPQTICDLTGGFIAGDWTRVGVILFASGAAGLMRAPAARGQPSVVTTLEHTEHEIYHRKATSPPNT